MKPFIAVEVRGKACTRCMFRDASYAECCAAAAAAVKAGQPDCDDVARPGHTIVYVAPPTDPRQPDLF